MKRLLMSATSCLVEPAASYAVKARQGMSSLFIVAPLSRAHMLTYSPGKYGHKTGALYRDAMGLDGCGV